MVCAGSGRLLRRGRREQPTHAMGLRVIEHPCRAAGWIALIRVERHTGAVGAAKKLAGARSWIGAVHRNQQQQVALGRHGAEDVEWLRAGASAPVVAVMEAL